MSKMKFKLNRQGVSQLLKGQEMMSIVEKQASNIQSRCGDGFATDSHVGRNRVNAMVYADTIPAKRRNNRENTLLKAMR